MKRISDTSLVLYATVIYAISALLLPVIFELWQHAIVGSRVIPGEADAIESMVRWPVVAILILLASVIPALMLLTRFSKFKLLVLSLFASIFAEALISCVIFWLNSHPMPAGYSTLAAIRNLNSSNTWPYEADWHLVASLLRIAILPLSVLGMGIVGSFMLKSSFDKNLKSAVN